MRELVQQRRDNGKYQQWQKDNPDKIKEYNDRRRHKRHDINQYEWDCCLQYFDNICAYCGMSLEEHYEKFNEQLHKEHVIHDGRNDLSNCVPACKVCNSSKWEHFLEDWYVEGNPDYSHFNQDRLNRIYKWINKDHKQFIQEKKPRKKYERKNKNIK